MTVLGLDKTHRGPPSWVRDQLTGKWRLTERFETICLDLAGSHKACSAIALLQTPSPWNAIAATLGRWVAGLGWP